MGSLTRLLVLALAVTAVVAKGARGGRPRPLSMDQQFALMQVSGCLPDDITAPDTTSCQSLTGKLQKLQCMASSAGLSGDSGYDQAGAEAFVDSLSSDDQWRADQKELLAGCSAMMPEDLAADKQGAFILACWHQLMAADCTKQRLVAAAVAADAEAGEEVAEVVATMAEGHCFMRGLTSDEAKSQWETCIADSDVDMQVVKGAGFYYMMLAMGKADLPEITAENVTAVAEQLEKLEAAAACYALASGDVSDAGEIDYDQIKATIDGATGEDEIKEAANAIVDACQGESPASIEEFYECYHAAQPSACAALKSYALVMGRKPGGGKGRGGRGGNRGGRGGNRRGRGGRRGGRAGGR